MKKIMAIILAVSLMLVMASCTSGTTATSPTTGTSGAATALQPKNGSKFKIVYAAVTTSLAPWTVALADNFQKQCDDNGWDCEIYDGMGDQQKQASQIDTVITNSDSVDLCVIFPTDPNSGATYAQKLSEAGVPVIMLNCDIAAESQQYAKAYVGPDNAKMTGELVKYVETKLGADKALNYVCISGVQVQQDYIEREKGLAAEIANTKYTQLGSTQYAMSDRSKAKTYMESFLTQYPNIDVFFGLSDDLTLGGIQAIEAAGKTSDITVVSIDGMNEAFQAIKDGKLDMTVQNPASEFMSKFAEVSKKLFNGDSVDYYQYTTYNVITKDNVDQFTPEY